MTRRPAGAATEPYPASRTSEAIIGPLPWKPTEHRGPARTPSARQRGNPPSIADQRGHHRPAAAETHRGSRTSGATIGPPPWKPTEHRGPAGTPSARRRGNPPSIADHQGHHRPAAAETHGASRTIGATPARPRDFSSLSASPKQGGYRHRTRGSDRRGGRWSVAGGRWPVVGGRWSVVEWSSGRVLGAWCLVISS